MGTIYIDFVFNPEGDYQYMEFLTRELESRGWAEVKGNKRHKGDWDYSRFKLNEEDLESFKKDVKDLCIPFDLKETFNRDFFLIEEK